MNPHVRLLVDQSVLVRALLISHLELEFGEDLYHEGAVHVGALPPGQAQVSVEHVVLEDEAHAAS